MMRRGFVLAAMAVAAAVISAGCACPSGGMKGKGCATGGGKQWIELRKYSFANPGQMKAYEEFLAKTAIPAFNRAGVQPVGVYKLLKADNASLPIPSDPLELYVILPHASPCSVAKLAKTMDADSAYRAEGKAVVEAPKSAPAFTRIETQMLLAFDEMPAVAAPAKGDARLLQLRIYESANEDRAARKIEMFNAGGEINIFKRCGMTAVFFGQSLAGVKLPNLTYALGFDDQAAMDAAWAKFRQDPEWIKLKDNPKYADTVSNITNLVLRPVAGSQI